MNNILSFLTEKEREFIQHHGIAPSDIYDARGKIIKVYHEEAKRQGCYFLEAEEVPCACQWHEDTEEMGWIEDGAV